MGKSSKTSHSAEIWDNQPPVSSSHYYAFFALTQSLTIRLSKWAGERRSQHVQSPKLTADSDLHIESCWNLIFWTLTDCFCWNYNSIHRFVLHEETLSFGLCLMWRHAHTLAWQVIAITRERDKKLEMIELHKLSFIKLLIVLNTSSSSLHSCCSLSLLTSSVRLERLRPTTTARRCVMTVQSQANGMLQWGENRN